MDIIEKLNNLGQEAMERFPSLNSGGCAVFASLVADELAKQGIEAEGVVAMDFWDYTPNIDKARKHVNNVDDGDEWEANGVRLSHVGLKLNLNGKEMLYDSEGLRPVNRTRNSLMGYDVIQGTFTREELRALADNAWNWNSMFNRQNIPKLKKLIESELRTHDNQ